MLSSQDMGLAGVALEAYQCCTHCQVECQFPQT